MLAKVLRKLGLGHTAYLLAAPVYSMFCKNTLDSPREALSLLHETSPDPSSSCYAPEKYIVEEESGLDLDIIIAAYNAQNYIQKCLDSVLSQETEYKYRAIVIDDGSTDDTGKILDSYKDIYLIHQENKGFSGARNTGLARASAEYIMFLDSDDELCPGAVQALMSRAKKTGAAIVEGSYSEIFPDGRVMRRHIHRDGPMKAIELEGFTCGKIIKSSLFNRLFFPLDYWYEDSIMRQVIFSYADLKGFASSGISAPVFLYRQNPKGITRSSRGRSKSLDSLYITMGLFEDRKKFGLDITADYYDYILSMAVQTYSRTKLQSPEVQRAIFTVYADFLERNFSGWNTENRQLRCLEKALRERNYGDYLAYCQLH